MLINTPLAADLIRKGEVHELKALMKRSTEHGMQTFDQALYNLYSQGEITYEDALLYADSANDLRLMIKLGSETDGEHLTSVPKGCHWKSATKIRGGASADLSVAQVAAQDKPASAGFLLPCR